MTTGLCRRYGRRWALANVDLQFAAGRSVMIAGRNGSGKSTLLRIIATAIRPDRGLVLVEGYDVRSMKADVRHRIALLGHASNAYEALTALQNLTMTARMAGIDADRKALIAVLERVDLGEWRDAAVSSFSAGMRRRVAFARLLLQTDPIGPSDRSRKASIVLLDEPYAHLDPPGFGFVDGLIRSFTSRGMTLLMATHLLERGARLCDDGVVLEEGQLGWSGPAANLPRLGGLQAVECFEESDQDAARGRT
jgi:ABC-type multidrug transport system ATPase subunit